MPASGDILASDVHFKNIRDGDWSRVQFLSQRLYDMFEDIAVGGMFKTRKLSEVADIHYMGRQVRGAFRKTSLPGKGCVLSVHGHETNLLRTIQVTPSDYICPKEGKENEAKRIWVRRGSLLFPERLRTNLAHVAILYARMPTVGSAWVPVIPRPPGMTTSGDVESKNVRHTRNLYVENWSRAMTVYMNSTAGIVSLMGVQDPKAFAFPRWSLSNLERLHVPALSDAAMKKLVATFDANASRGIGRWRDRDDPVRILLDSAVADALLFRT